VVLNFMLWQHSRPEKYRIQTQSFLTRGQQRFVPPTSDQAQSDQKPMQLEKILWCKTTVILSGFLKITRPTGVVSSAAPTDFGADAVMRDQGGGALEANCGP
jgi:hypothetical protein